MAGDEKFEGCCTDKAHLREPQQIQTGSRTGSFTPCMHTASVDFVMLFQLISMKRRDLSLLRIVSWSETVDFISGRDYRLDSFVFRRGFFSLRLDERLQG